MEKNKRLLKKPVKKHPIILDEFLRDHKNLEIVFENLLERFQEMIEDKKVSNIFLEAVHQTEFTKNIILVVGKKENFEQYREQMKLVAKELGYKVTNNRPLTINDVEFVFKQPEEVSFLTRYKDESEVPIEFWDNESLKMSPQELKEKKDVAINNLFGEIITHRRW